MSMSIVTVYLFHQTIAGFTQPIDTCLQHFEGKQGTFQAHRTQVNTKHIKDILLVELLYFFNRLANDGFDQQIGRGLRDGTAMPIETRVGDLALSSVRRVISM